MQIGKNMNDVTFLIRGPFKTDSCRFYNHFYPDLPKVFYCWKGESSGGTFCDSLRSSKDIFMENDEPGRLGSWGRKIELEIVGALFALNRVETEFVVKLRGDEWYSNLGGIVGTLKNEQKEKIVMAPVFIKKWEVWPFRMGDHLLAGRTEDLRLMFKAGLANMVTNAELYAPCWPLPSQSMLAKSYMDMKNPGGENGKEDFKRLFGTVDLNSLQPYKVNSDNGEKSWYSDFKPCVSNLEEL